MKIASIEINNYKSFKASGKLLLSDQCNFIVGQNNSGKTSFLECMASGLFVNKPHLCVDVPPGNEPSVSEAIFEFRTSGAEIKDIVLRSGSNNALPCYSFIHQGNQQQWIERFFSLPEISIRAVRRTGHWEVLDCKARDIAAPFTDHIQITMTADKRINFSGSGAGFGLFTNNVSRLFTENCYNFKAERLSIPQIRIEGNSILSPDCANLSDVLLSFYNRKRDSFDNFSKDISDIFPNIYRVLSHIFIDTAAVPNTLQNTTFPFVVTKIKPTNTPEDREDICFNLQDCGSGVAQVISLLYIVHESKRAKTIVIDEPNSFLHPGALRKLMKVFDKFDQHQYVISTHSADTINSLEFASVHLVKWSDGESNIETLPADGANKARSILEELGIRLVDVFGADNIIWVEGPTEAICFPLILDLISRPISSGTRFIPVISATEIAKNTTKAQNLVSIYQAVSSSNAIIPPALAIALDRESFHDDQIAAMEVRFGGLVHFLNRRCIENYALATEGIASILEQEGFAGLGDGKTVGDSVADWMKSNAANEKYRASAYWQPSGNNEAWLKKVDGAELLNDLFNEVTNSIYSFRKTRHTPMLIRWNFHHRNEETKELIQFVSGLVPCGQ